MSIGDLEHGWHQARFELSNVKIVSKVQLRETDDDGDWVERAPSSLVGVFAKTDEQRDELLEGYSDLYEADDNLIYAKPKRMLRADASVSDDFSDRLYLGIPKEKDGFKAPRETELEHIQVSIREADDLDLKEIIKWREKNEEAPTNIFKCGTVGYLIPDEFGGGYAYAELYVPKETFDDIEHMASEQSVTFEISLNMKGWHWTDPIGGHQTYIDKDKGRRDPRDKAELSEISVSKVFQNRPKNDEDIVDEYGEPKITINNLNQQLLVMQQQAASIKVASWLTALAVLAVVSIIIL